MIRNKKVVFSTGRSAESYGTKEQTLQWFQEFVDKVVSPDYVPQIV